MDEVSGLLGDTFIYDDANAPEFCHLLNDASEEPQPFFHERIGIRFGFVLREDVDYEIDLRQVREVPAITSELPRLSRRSASAQFFQYARLAISRTTCIERPMYKPGNARVFGTNRMYSRRQNSLSPESMPISSRIKAALAKTYALSGHYHHTICVAEAIRLQIDSKIYRQAPLDIGRNPNTLPKYMKRAARMLSAAYG